MMDNEVKTVIDVSAGGITVGAVFDFLPEATALASLVWVLHGKYIYNTNWFRKAS